MYIDTHCHLSKEDYNDIDLIINNNRAANVDKIIISGCTRDTIIESLELAKRYDDVFLTIGFHPSEVLLTTDNDLIFLEKSLNNNKVVGIGEIGLDYHYDKENIMAQQNLFRKQLLIARKYKLPVVIHSRDATLDTINILSEYPDIKCVIHCFSGSVETAKKYISMGYMLGIGGVLTFKNSNLYKVIKEIGLDNIVIETDSPYLTPEPYRGKKNSSKYIYLVVKKISEILDIDEDVVSKKILNNTYCMFDLSEKV